MTFVVQLKEGPESYRAVLGPVVLYKAVLSFDSVDRILQIIEVIDSYSYEWNSSNEVIDNHAKGNILCR